MIPLVIGRFGLVIGSFLNVVIHSVPLRRSIVCPSSSCPHCGARIKMLDNVPVLSYLLLRRRYLECGVRISLEVFLAATGIFTMFLGQEPWASYLRLIREA